MTQVVRAAASDAPILTERLAQLGEPERMKPLLQEALEQLGADGARLQGYAIDHCKVTPWRDISIALSLVARSTHTGEPTRHVISGTIFPSLDAARRQLREERRMSLPGAIGTASPALVPEMAMVVRLFPDDSGLTGLRGATDAAAIRALLTAHLPECREQGWAIRTIEFEPVQYKPGRLCTLRYALTLDHAGHESKPVEAFGKVYRDERWRRSYELLDATRQAAAASGGVWCAAQPIAAVPAWRFVLQRAIAGRDFRHLLGELTKPDAHADDIGQAERCVTAVARAVQAIQLSPIPPGPRLDFRVLFAAQCDNLEHLRQVNAPLAGELQELRAAISRLAEECPPGNLCPAHGDFAHGNVLVATPAASDPCIGVIDFDRAGEAEPAYDVAYFLTHLSSFAMRHPERAAHVRRLSDHLRRMYCQLAPAVSARRLALYEALDLSAYVLRNFRKRSHQPEWIGWATGQIASAWERLDYVSAETRAGS